MMDSRLVKHMMLSPQDRMLYDIKLHMYKHMCVCVCVSTYTHIYVQEVHIEFNAFLHMPPSKGRKQIPKCEQ